MISVEDGTTSVTKTEKLSFTKTANMTRAARSAASRLLPQSIAGRAQNAEAVCGYLPWKIVAKRHGLYNQLGGGNSSTGRAPDCGSDGCGFDSRFPPQIFPSRCANPCSDGRLPLSSFFPSSRNELCLRLACFSGYNALCKKTACTASFSHFAIQLRRSVLSSSACSTECGPAATRRFAS